MDAHGNRRDYEGMEVCGGELLEFVRKNRSLSEDFCTKLYQELFAPIQWKIENEVETYTYRQLEEDVTKLNDDYLKRSIGPKKWSVLSDMDKKTVKQQKNNFKRLKGYQENVMKEKQRLKEAENEMRQRTQELKTLHQEAVRAKEKNAENLRNMQENFQRQMEKLKLEEAKRREEEMKKLQDLQKTNFTEFQGMIKEFNQTQNRSIGTMMENLKLEREQNKEQMSKLTNAIASIPKPPPPPAPKKKRCSIM